MEDPNPTPTTPSRGQAAVPSPETLASRLPQYEIQTLLGRGGMGAVYRARQRKLDRLVAIKLLLPDLDDDPEFAERFAREARTLARLNHPGIVGIHDFGEADGIFYLIMEYVEGANLRELMASGRMTPRDALALIPQICDALQFAHDAGIVHRDIKPENILVDQDGRVRIADFGLAKLVDGEQPTIGLTRTHQGMGTPHYMAPEQVGAASQVDHRADIYSLGVVLYEMLTGELPIGRFGPPSAKAPDSARLDPVVMKSLASDPSERYQHARDVKSDLETGSQGTQPAEPNTRQPHRRPTARHTATPAIGPQFPRRSWALAVVVFVASFMSWGRIPARPEGMPFALGNFSFDANAWNSNIAGIPTWILTLLAIAIATSRTIRMRGTHVPPVLPLVLIAYGLAHSASWFVILATADNGSSPGIGSFVTAVCFLAFIASQLHDHAASRTRAHRLRRRRRHHHARAATPTSAQRTKQPQ